MMSLPKNSSKEELISKPVKSSNRSSSYGSRTSTYFDKSIIQVSIVCLPTWFGSNIYLVNTQVGSGDDSDEEDWTPEGAAHRCNICRKNFPSRFV